jgi:hypothetical protein
MTNQLITSEKMPAANKNKGLTSGASGLWAKYRIIQKTHVIIIAHHTP